MATYFTSPTSFVVTTTISDLAAQAQADLPNLVVRALQEDGQDFLLLLEKVDNGEIVDEELRERRRVDLAAHTQIPQLTDLTSTVLRDWLMDNGYKLQMARRRGVATEYTASGTPVEYATPEYNAQVRLPQLGSFTTAKELRSYLDGLAVREEAADALVKETAHHRHSYRVSKVEETALKAGRDWFDLMDDTAGEKRGQYGQVAYVAGSALLIALDLAGIGGRDACDGAGTDRMGWAQRLGSGRKQAGDGAAWTSAQKYALGRLVQMHGYALVIAPMPEMVPGDRHSGLDLWIVDGAGEVVPTSTCGVLVRDLSSGMLAWFRTLAREGLRLSLGQSGWLTELPEEIRFTGPAGDWARVVNEIQRRIFAPFDDTETRNYHVTWTESGLTSDGWTDEEPGEYEPSEESGRTARCVVAPGPYVREFLRTADPQGRYTGTAAQAVRAYARDKGWYCG